MILSCPQCGSQFSLDPAVLSPAGKKVRCSSCSETWFQEPDLVELRQQRKREEKELEEIPDGVKPLPDGSNVPVLSDQPIEDPPNGVLLKTKLTSYLLAFFVFILVGFVLFMSRNALVNAYTPLYKVYDVLGIETELPGQGLVFDRLSLNRQDGQIVLNGYIVNLTPDDQSIPVMKAFLRDADGGELASWNIAPPQKMIAKEETLSFEAAYEGDYPEGVDVTVSFSIQ